MTVTNGLSKCVSGFALTAFQVWFPAWSQNIPFNRDHLAKYESYFLDCHSELPSAFKPWIFTSDLANSIHQENFEKILANKRDTIRTNIFHRKLHKEHFLVVKSGKHFNLSMDVLFDLETGRAKDKWHNKFPDFNDGSSQKKIFCNSRGYLLTGKIRENVSFETSFLESQAVFPTYQDTFIRTYGVVPGSGRTKVFKSGAFDYSMSSGNFSWNVNSHFNLQAGHCKHFIGEGYRSLLLSDNAFNYPFLRITSAFGAFQYTNLYASFMNLTTFPAHVPKGTEALFQKKAASIQFLSWQPCRYFQISLFQALINQASDSTNKQTIRWNFANPVILTNLPFYGLNDRNNILLGANAKATVCRKTVLYGQFILDDFSFKYVSPNHLKTWGYQAGVKAIDLFGLKSSRVQIEYNQVQPYTFGKMEQPSQSYTHYNQALAHPLGANFKEICLLAEYTPRTFFFLAQATLVHLGEDWENLNFGANPFKGDLYQFNTSRQNIYINGQGIRSTLYFSHVEVGYTINPLTNFQLFAAYSSRFHKNFKGKDESTFFQIGLRTRLLNYYTDY